MFEFFPKGLSTMNIVVLGMKDNQVVAVRSFTVSNSRHDKWRFTWKDGLPVIGSRVYRQMTKKEKKAAGLTSGAAHALPRRSARSEQRSVPAALWILPSDRGRAVGGRKDAERGSIRLPTSKVRARPHRTSSL